MPSTHTLQLLSEHFSIHSLPIAASIPEKVLNAPIYFIGKTHEEISILLPSHIQIASDEVESGWRALEIVGPLGFSLTGILSNISTVLANEKISILTISTFDTDYIFIKDNTVNKAIEALTSNQYHVIFE